MDLNFQLHDQQLEILKSSARFKVCAAGRRGGKSYLAAVICLIEGLKDFSKEGKKLSNKRIFYVSPTFDQSKRNVWDLIKELGGWGTPQSVIASTLENQGIITLVNGRKIELKGADRPDTLLGIGLSYLIMDEYADMKPDVWERILRPTLSDVKGGAMFIGTPRGKNHFYDLYKLGLSKAKQYRKYKAFTFKSLDNPYLDEEEISDARGELSTAIFKQEYEASFTASSGTIFKQEYFKYAESPPRDGEWYVSLDPAGYASIGTTTSGKLSRLDEHAIAIVKVCERGWYVAKVIHGRWGVRETSIKLLRAAQEYKAMAVGIEKGSLKNALMPYLFDQMSRLNTYPHIVETTHGNQKKTERVAWALEGRFEHGRIFFSHDETIKQLEEQLLDFPNPLAHDDLVDALAYIDQVAKTDFDPDDGEEEDWEELETMGANSVTGY